MKDLFEYSTPELVRMLGTRFKDYRMRCSLTQKEVSELSGVGLTTIHKFENGTAGGICDLPLHFADLKQAYVFGIYKALQKYDISTGVPFLIFK